MADWAVVRGEGPVDSGVVTLVGPEQGAIHLDVALVSLGPEEQRSPELNPFEESFYLLEGEAVLEVDGGRNLLRGDDHGFVPVAVTHRWSNPGGTVARYLRVRAPQPRAGAETTRDFTMPAVSGDPEPIEPAHPATRRFGHFEMPMIPPPGPIQMRGFRSSAARNVSVWMLVDEIVGAVHHTLFMVSFAPTGQTVTLGGQHYHPFEEIYYIVEGEAIAHLEDESHPVGAGDVIFAGVNALHGFSNTTDRPVRWIEAQAPAPPPAGAFFFPSHWEG